MKQEVVCYMCPYIYTFTVQTLRWGRLFKGAVSISIECVLLILICGSGSQFDDDTKMVSLPGFGCGTPGLSQLLQLFILTALLAKLTAPIQ